MILLIITHVCFMIACYNITSVYFHYNNLYEPACNWFNEATHGVVCPYVGMIRKKIATKTIVQTSSGC